MLFTGPARGFLFALIVFASTFTTTDNVRAQTGMIPAPPQVSASSYLLMDAKTGEILVQHNIDAALPPASLTKMMTSYIVAGEIERGNLDKDSLVDVSVKAWKMGGSRMFIREGTQVAVEDLLRGVIIQSGNDASVALAEKVAGSEEAFVDMMNQQAALLGMNATHHENATGWPADGHVTTARDLATLTRALIRDYPQHYGLYAEEQFEYNDIEQFNRNRLLFRDPSVDGVKTGYTEKAGYALVSSAVEDGMRLISVVLGARSEDARAVESQKLLTYGFRYYQTHKLFASDDEIRTVRVWSGMADALALGVTEDILLTIPRGAEDKLQATVSTPEAIKAPIAADEELGTLTVRLGGERLLGVPLVAEQAVKEAGLFARLWDSAKLFFMDVFNLL